MIYEALIRSVCSPDPLEQAQQSRRMKVSGDIIRQRRALVHSALARSIPTAPVGPGCSGSAS